MERRSTATFKTLFRETFPYEPTPGQEIAIDSITEYLFHGEQHQLLILKGYAGTGKTTLISAFVQALSAINIKNILLAPTGRAAKVIGGYAGKKAHTIHRFIYWVFTKPTGGLNIIPRENKYRDTIFLVDEVSMISGNSGTNDSGFGNRNILDDLIKYVYQGENCKMIFIGDSAQLPPVGTILSPALDPEKLRSTYNLDVTTLLLDEVVRQEAASGILLNATSIREKIATENCTPPFFETGFSDIILETGSELMDALAGAFYRDSLESSVIVTRSNKRANKYNSEIRNRILFRENEIDGGDLMMVVKNNYYWLPETSEAGFIANGDIIEILRIRHIEEVYGFRFADALIRLVDYPDEKEMEVKLLLDTIQSESANLPQEQNLNLYHAVKEGSINSKPPSEDPHYNALQVKFAYALTCHKTQGGQWENVFLDQGWLSDEMIDKEYFRWLYTAATRATEKLYLLGFNDEYLTYNKDS